MLLKQVNLALVRLARLLLGGARFQISQQLFSVLTDRAAVLDLNFIDADVVIFGGAPR